MFDVKSLIIEGHFKAPDVRDPKQPNGVNLMQDKSVRKVSLRIFSRLGAFLSSLFCIKKHVVKVDEPKKTFEQSVTVRDGLTVKLINGIPRAVEVHQGENVKEFGLDRFYDGKLSDFLHEYIKADSEVLCSKRGRIPYPELTEEQSTQKDWLDAESTLLAEVKKIRKIEKFATVTNDPFYKMEGKIGGRQNFFVAGFKTKADAQSAKDGAPVDLKKGLRLIELHDSCYPARPPHFWVVSANLRGKDLLTIAVIDEWQRMSSYQKPSLEARFADEKMTIWDHAEGTLDKSNFQKDGFALFKDGFRQNKYLKSSETLEILDGKEIWKWLIPLAPKTGCISITDDNEALVPFPSTSKIDS